MEEPKLSIAHQAQLNEDVCKIIEGSQQRLATTINADICMLHWNIGKRIKEDVLFNQRAEYGKQMVKSLANLLTQKYGKRLERPKTLTLYTRRVYFYCK